jgi:hypothetical protein
MEWSRAKQATKMMTLVSNEWNGMTLVSMLDRPSRPSIDSHTAEKRPVGEAHFLVMGLVVACRAYLLCNYSYNKAFLLARVHNCMSILEMSWAFDVVPIRITAFFQLLNVEFLKS